MTDTTTVDFKAEATKMLVIDALEALKAINIIIIDVRDRASFTDTMVFASGTSKRHVISISESVIEATDKAGCPPLGVEGEDVGEWVLVDLGDVVVHVMLPDVRLFYELEKLWGEELAEPI